jgi:glycerate kinase
MADPWGRSSSAAGDVHSAVSRRSRRRGSIDLKPVGRPLLSVRFEAFPMSNNPLLGPEGAARGFSPPEGLGSPKRPNTAKTGSRFAVVGRPGAAGRASENHSGAGAAGGLGFG